LQLKCATQQKLSRQQMPANKKITSLNTTMITGRDFVIINPQSWQTDVSGNSRNIALALAAHNRVLFCNPPIDRSHLIKRKDDRFIQEHLQLTGNRKQIHIKKLGENLWNLFPTAVAESVRWMPHGMFNVFNKINNQRFATDIKAALAELGFSNIIILNDTEMFKGFYLKEMLQPDLYMYYSKDYMLDVPFWMKHGRKLEPALMRKTDLGVANSTYLRDLYKKQNPNAYYIGQGTNLQVFDVYKQREIPADLKNIPHPIVGYVGALTTLRIDPEVLKTIAVEMPDWSLVLVGPWNETFPKEALAQYKNIYFLDRKPLEQLPDYITGFDVCINPQLINPTTIGNYPLKVDEYLAMGKPVVASATEGMKMFEAYSFLAATPQHYPPLIRKAHEENNAGIRERRIEFARSHTWENCALAIYDAIEKTYQLQKR
ncbi:MAG: hypothetical protein RLZZ316_2436, partial [Bacteroidota bacterium]